RYPALTVMNQSTVRTRLRWLTWPTLVSAVLLAHFLVSVGIWVYWFVGILRNPYMRNEFVPSLYASASAFLLCGFSGVAFVLALRGRTAAKRGVAVLFIASIT